MTISDLLLVISIVIFVIAAVPAARVPVNLVALGLAVFAASFLPIG